MTADQRTLEEQLTQRLYRVGREASGDFRPWSSIGNEAKAPYLRLAADVLRIVEWNIRQQVLAAHGADWMHSLSADPRVKPTMPPDHWTTDAK